MENFKVAPMISYKFTQRGTFSVIILSVSIIFCILMWIFIGPAELIPSLILGFVVLVLAVFLMSFYKLTVEVNEKYLKFSMGIGLFGKKFPLSEISGCKAVKNPLWWGIGIRLTPEGWLYNVSGRNAVELKFNSGRGSIRIGADNPEELASVVNRLTEKNPEASTFEGTKNRAFYFILIILAVTMFFTMGLLISGSKDPEYLFSVNSLSISGMYGKEINFSEINSVKLLDELPAIRSRTNGFATAKVLKGNFRLNDGRRVILFVKKNNPPYIEIGMKGNDLYINTQVSDSTISIYKRLAEKSRVQ